MHKLREHEFGTMLQKLAECLYEAAKANHDAAGWIRRAEDYRKAMADAHNERCSHCGALGGMACGHDGADRLCPACLSNTMD